MVAQLSMGKVRRQHDSSFATDLHHLKGLGPTGHNLVEGEVGGPFVDGGVEGSAVDEFAIEMCGDGIVDGGSGTGAIL